jgi:hypothetical protein
MAFFMADLINLRRARKGKKREADAKAAETARAAHGVTKPVKKLAEARAAKEKRDFAAHRLEPGDDK